MKDLDQPERVWQLLHPNLRADFPPLTSELARLYNLPNQISSFVGRGRKLAEIIGLLGATRLLAPSGIGGVGKTRLAMEVARTLATDDGTLSPSSSSHR